ncbi:MAG: thermonuclease family protein [Hyphomonadaceae bacterium]|jgi:endonuclease YncB( thermonuclease family)|nr:thermonuclease family protein [Hyphomonadaceae bacterium]
MDLRHAAAVAASLFGAIIVIDGDTVKFEGRSYRLLGCDAPELGRARCWQEYQLGLKAKKRLEELLEAIEPRLVPNGKTCGFGRPCAYLYAGPRDACQVLIEEGLARPCGGPGCVRSWCD